jgi:hypothetical protein
MDAEESSVEVDLTMVNCDTKQFHLENRGGKKIITVFRA